MVATGTGSQLVDWQIDPDAVAGGGALCRVEHRLHAHRVVEGDRGFAPVVDRLKEVEKGVERGPAVPWQRPRLRHADDPVLRLPEADVQPVSADVARPGDFVDDPAPCAVHLDPLVVEPPQAQTAGVHDADRA